MEGAENIRVICRFRPLVERELELDRTGSNANVKFGADSRSVWVGPDECSGNYTLDAVLPPEATQQNLYCEASALVDAVMQGYNGTLLAYGQTGSGKTHSVMGALGGDEESVGLLPRAVAQIFERIVNDESGAEFAVSCSYLEIYKEVVRDLLQPTTKPGGLAIREDARNRARGIYVEDLTEVYVMGEADVLECLSCGNANRVVGTTLMNSQSSRSHALLTIKVQQKMPDGSTKVAKTGSTGETLNEAKKINASLSTLCLVISALSDGKPHIPYRNSKLTRILQESLGGNSKTMMLVACSPSMDNAAETHSSLRFAMRAKRVRNAAVVNRVLSVEELTRSNASLRLELLELRRQLNDVRGGTEPGYCPSFGASHIEEVVQLRESVAEAQAQLCECQEQVQALQAELDDERQEKSAVTSALKDREEELKLLFETLAGFQVLHGVQPICSRDSKANIDQLRRQLLAAEELALEKEMGMADEDASRVLVAALRAQISEQDRRIRELEHSAEQAAHAAAAQQEVAQLKEQLRELIQSKLVQVGRAAAGGLCTRTSGDSLATDECFMAKEAFGQHLLRKANPHCSSPTKPNDRRRSQGVKVINSRMSFIGEPAGMSLLAQAEAADVKKKLQLETSRCQALQRKVDCLSQQLAKAGSTQANCTLVGDALHLQDIRTRQEVRVVQRIYASALREAESEVQLAACKGKLAAALSERGCMVVAQALGLELRVLEARAAAAVRTRSATPGLSTGCSTSSLDCFPNVQDFPPRAHGRADKEMSPELPHNPDSPEEWHIAEESPCASCSQGSPPFDASFEGAVPECWAPVDAHASTPAGLRRTSERLPSDAKTPESLLIPEDVDSFEVDMHTGVPHLSEVLRGQRGGSFVDTGRSRRRSKRSGLGGTRESFCAKQKGLPTLNEMASAASPHMAINAQTPTETVPPPPPVDLPVDAIIVDPPCNIPPPPSIPAASSLKARQVGSKLQHKEVGLRSLGSQEAVRSTKMNAVPDENMVQGHVAARKNVRMRPALAVQAESR